MIIYIIVIYLYNMYNIYIYICISYIICMYIIYMCRKCYICYIYIYTICVRHHTASGHRRVAFNLAATSSNVETWLDTKM